MLFFFYCLDWTATTHGGKKAKLHKNVEFNYILDSFWITVDYALVDLTLT